MSSFSCMSGGPPKGETKGWRCEECASMRARLAEVERDHAHDLRVGKIYLGRADEAEAQLVEIEASAALREEKLRGHIQQLTDLVAKGAEKWRESQSRLANVEAELNRSVDEEL